MVSSPRVRNRNTAPDPDAPSRDHPQAPPGFIERVASRLRARSTRVVDGVRYRERRPNAVKGLLPTSSPDSREYEVRFPGIADRTQRPMRIRASRLRIYDDLTPDPRVELCRALDRLIRPGDRVLLLGSGTGAAASKLAYLVGPSGGVVALDRDGESVRFARQRYTDAQTGFELGWTETLSGELDDAFDAIVAADPLRDASNQIERARTASEILRVIRPEGHLLCIGSSSESWELARRTFEPTGVEPVGPPSRSDDWRASLYRVPAHPDAARTPGRP